MHPLTPPLSSYAVCSWHSHCCRGCVPCPICLPRSGMAVFLRAERCLLCSLNHSHSLPFSRCRCLYPQPRVSRPGAKGLSAGRAQGGVPPPVCPANRGWSQWDLILSAALWAQTRYTRAPGNGPGLGADPEEARKGLGWHVCPVRHAQHCEDCVSVRTRQPSQLPARLTSGCWPARDWRNTMCIKPPIFLSFILICVYPPAHEVAWRSGRIKKSLLCCLLQYCLGWSPLLPVPRPWVGSLLELQLAWCLNKCVPSPLGLETSHVITGLLCFFPLLVLQEPSQVR